MDELHDLQTTMDAVLKLQREQGYALCILKQHPGVYHGLLKFMKANNYTTLNMDIGFEYVQNLLVYMKSGSVSYYMRPKLADLQCPEGFEEEYLLSRMPTKNAIMPMQPS